jgi:NTP-dependent ternary conflict system VMAP-like protein/effector-associated domain 2 (EAD2)-containing protein
MSPGDIVVGDPADLVAQFAGELRRLRGAAGDPSLGTLVRRAAGVVNLNPQSLSDWLNGKSVPADRVAVAFLARHLEPVAAQRSDYRPRGVPWWLDLHRRAWTQRHRGRVTDLEEDGRSPGETVSRTVRRLAWALGRVPQLEHRLVRDEVVAALRARLDPDLRVSRSDDRDTDLLAIVAACVYLRSGPRALADAVQDVLPDAPSAVAFASEVARLVPVPALLSDAQREDLLAALSLVSLAYVDLAGLYELSTDYGDPLRCGPSMLSVVAELEALVSPQPLFRFVELIASAAVTTAQQHLQRWVDMHLGLLPPEQHAELRRLRDYYATRSLLLGRRTHVLTSLTRFSDTDYQIRSWIVVGGRDWAANHEPGRLVSLREARGWFAELVDRYRDGPLASGKQPVLEFFLTPDQLNEPVDAWPVTGEDGWPVPAGVCFAVVVRPAGRTVDAAWRTRWQALVSNQERGAETVTRWVPDTAEEKVADLGGDADWAVAAVTCPELANAPQSIMPLLSLGTPVALWIRDASDAGERMRRMTETITAWEVMQLPERVRGVRRLAWEENYRAAPDPLVLLWDDPTRVPPGDPAWTAPPVRSAAS